MLIIALCQTMCFGQLSNITTKKIATKGLVKIDEKSIVPSSIIIQNVDTTFYTIDAVRSLLI